MAVKVCRAYCTVSYETVMVLASVPPIHLMAWERKVIYESEEPRGEERLRIRRELMVKWQEEWEATEKGAWTKALISNVTDWVNRGHGAMDYHIAQALSGHGSFKTYTHKIRKSQDDRCSYYAERDTPEHTLFNCERWSRARTVVNLELGADICTSSMIPLMLSSEKQNERSEERLRPRVGNNEED